jgi:hypothetical protein
MEKTRSQAEAVNQQVENVLLPTITEEQIQAIRELTNKYNTWEVWMSELNDVVHRYMQCYLRAAAADDTFRDHHIILTDVEYDIFKMKQLIDTAQN